MKKRFLSAVILAAAATILIGGCEQQGAGEDGERGGSFSMTNQQVYADGVAITEAETYTVKMQIWSEEGDPEPYGEVIGTVTDGKLSFTLPDTIDESVLTAFFDELTDEDFYTLNIPEHKAFPVMGFAVFNGDDNRVGTLFYHSAEGMILFLYSPSPFTITGTKTLSGETHEINAAFGTGWNTSLIPQGNKKGLIYTGTPPADAKWVFTKNF